jgi:hypothetical protein
MTRVDSRSSRRAGDTSSYADFYAHSWDVRPSLDFPFVITAATRRNRCATRLGNRKAPLSHYDGTSVPLRP